jgi:hypothetical protein
MQAHWKTVMFFRGVGRLSTDYTALYPQMTELFVYILLFTKKISVNVLLPPYTYKSNAHI